MFTTDSELLYERSKKIFSIKTCWCEDRALDSISFNTGINTNSTVTDVSEFNAHIIYVIFAKCPTHSNLPNIDTSNT